MLGGKCYLSSKGTGYHRTLDWVFENANLVRQFRSIKFPEETSVWSSVALEVSPIDGLIEIESSTGDILICNYEQEIMTEIGMKPVHYLLWDKRHNDTEKRIKLLCTHNRKIIKPILLRAKKLGYGIAYKPVLEHKDSFLVVNNYIVK